MAKKLLRPEQYVAIEWLAQPKYGGKSLGDIAELCNIDPKTLYNWRRDDAFQAELKREMVRRSQDRLPELIESLADIAIRDGNAAMAKLALQINGMLVDKVEVETKTIEGTVDMDKVDAELERFANRDSGTDE
jgi:hypothetical protein